MKVVAYGDRGVLLAALSEVERQLWLEKLQADLPRDCEEYVIGHNSILLLGRELLAQFRAALPVTTPAELASHDAISVASSAGRRHVIQVNYDGDDLAAVAQACDLTIEQVIELHSAPIYTVRMMGFAPGFPYLDGLDVRLHLPRRASPRNHILPGSVAIGGSHAGIYSVASPGGWHLLGHTDVPLFDREAAQQANPRSEDVFALAAGDQVCFQPQSIR